MIYCSKDIHPSINMGLFKKKITGPVIKTEALKLHWDVENPFFFVSHHEDDYPKGNKQQAPPLQEIAGRNLGRDYQIRNGFRMYNGKVVPGFPMHAHWGYETITCPMLGYIDHHDSLGNHGRYGPGDVQWVTAGTRYQHNEMYPLINQEDRNPNDITQIMIYLPKSKRNNAPEVGMIWSEKIPNKEKDGVEIRVIAGNFEDLVANVPNKDSLANDSEYHISIVRFVMSPGSKIELKPISPNLNRNIYCIDGKGLEICGNNIEASSRVKLDGNANIIITNGNEPSTLWLLEGMPLNERIVSYGPIIHDTDQDVRKALDELRKTEFENWSWDYIDLAQPLGTPRHMTYGDGRTDYPE